MDFLNLPVLLEDLSETRLRARVFFEIRNVENDRRRVDRKRLTQVKSVMRWVVANALTVLSRFFQNLVWVSIFD